MGKRRDRRGLLDLVVLTDVFDGCENGCSPTNLVHARTHAELAKRPNRPIQEGLCFREKLELKDWSNWE